MPLLRRQPFVKEPVPEDIDLDEEVFHCKPTDEIFREYEQFFERVIVCNSLVWSCSLTGRPGLTYEEAVDSERKAMKHVQSFPQGLRCPVLLLATQTHRSRMNDMNDDVYSYIKDRFFVGEEVELAAGTEKKACRVVKIVPTASATQSNGHVPHLSDSDDPDRKKDSSAAFYKYTVEFSEGGSSVEVSPDQLSRPRRQVNRDKLKLFLKVHSEPIAGIWKIKDEFVNEFNLASVKYSTFFPSPLPVFAASVARKYKRQPKEESIVAPVPALDDEAEDIKSSYDLGSHYSPATMTPNRLKLTPDEKAFLRDKQRQEKMAEKIEKKEKIAVDRARLKEEKGKARKKLKEQKRLQAEVMKEWSKPRDDLECDDLKALPTPRSVTTRMQNELFGDVIMILEFFECFGDVIGLRDRFPQGLTLDTLEKALLESDVNGPLTDLLAVFLTAIFSCQDQEDEDVLMEAAVTADGQGGDGGNMDDAEDIDNASGALSHKELMASAVAAAQVPQLCHGVSLKEFPLDAFTVSEVLRLHFAASGARCNAASAKFRYQQRGGFMSLDDGGMELRRHDSDALLKALGTGNIFDMAPEAKLKIIEALITQLLGYSSYRDIVEDELDSLKQARSELRQLQWAEQRREKEMASARYRRRLEEKAKDGKVERKRGRKSNNGLSPEDGVDGLPAIPAGVADAAHGRDTAQAASARKDDGACTKEARKLAAKLLKDSARREAAAVAALSTDGRTRRKAAFEDSLDFSEFFDVDWDVVIACASNEEEKATLMVRREEVETKRKEAFVEKEREMQERAQRLGYKCGTHPLGRDRCYRRFWLFHSVPGLYVEMCDNTVPSDFATAYQLLLSMSNRQADVKENGSHVYDNTSKPFALESVAGNAGESRAVSLAGAGDLKSMTAGHNFKTEEGQLMVAFTSPDLVPLQESRWMCFGSEEDLDLVVEALNERGFRESGLKQALLDARPLLQQSLQKARGDDNRAAAGTDRTDKSVPQQTSRTKKSGRAQASAHTATPTTAVAKGRSSHTHGGSSAQEALELSLREALLDLEERLYAGALGTIKVADRSAWRHSVEYSSPTGGGDDKLDSAVNNSDSGAPAAGGDGDDRCPAVKVLCQALIEVQKGIDAKYLCQPLGDVVHDEKVLSSRVQSKQQKAAAVTVPAAQPASNAMTSGEDAPAGSALEGDAQKTGNVLPQATVAKAPMTTLERWQDSLLASTSISQIFLHLSTLEKAILWSKSALNARCTLCRRKGDGEKMLLCDGCDRGHHMYCLKPPVKEIPEGDWFCPECRPKQARPSRQRTKHRFGQDDESYMDGESGLLSSSSSSAEDDEDEDEEDGDEEKDDAEGGRADDEGAPPYVASSMGRDSPGDLNTHGKDKVKSRTKQRSRVRNALPSLEAGGSRGPTPKRSSVAASEQGSSKAKRSRTASVPDAVSSRPSADEQRSSGDSGRRQRRRDAPRWRSDSPAALEDEEEDQFKQSAAAESRSGRRAARSLDAPPVLQAAVSRSRQRTDGPAAQDAAQESGDAMQKCEELLSQLMKHEDAWPFLRPVSRREVPDYHTIIKHPMDFSTIKSKINLISYTDVQELVEDIRLVFQNCQAYNLESSEVYKSGEKLSKLFESKLKALRAEDSSSRKRARWS